MAQFLRHVTSSPHDADHKGDTFRHTIYPPRFSVIPFISLELQGAWIPTPPPPPRLNRVKIIDDVVRNVILVVYQFNSILYSHSPLLPLPLLSSPLSSVQCPLL